MEKTVSNLDSEDEAVVSIEQFDITKVKKIRYKEAEIREGKFYVITKRIIDFTASLLALIVLSPLLLIVSIIIKIESTGPVIFKQDRVGQGNKIFKMYKFRSMVANAEELKKNLEKQNEMSGPMFKIKEDPRVTKVGRFIRKTSIDELPQLLNILRGEMSLVGPRPSLPQEVAQFEPWMMRRLEVPQGLTCYWQVCGRSNVDFQEWMEMDVEYANNKSFMVDIKLIIKTIRVLFGDKNAC